MKIIIADSLSALTDSHKAWAEEILITTDEDFSGIAKGSKLVVNVPKRCKDYSARFYKTADFLNRFYAVFDSGSIDENIFLRKTRVGGFSFILVSEFMKKNPEQGAVKIEKINMVLFARDLSKEGHEVKLASVDPDLRDFVLNLDSGNEEIPFSVSILTTSYKICKALVSNSIFLGKRVYLNLLMKFLVRNGKDSSTNLIIPTNYPGNMQIKENLHGRVDLFDRHFGGFTEYLEQQKEPFTFLMHFDVPAKAIFKFTEIKSDLKRFVENGIRFQNSYLGIKDYLLSHLLSIRLTIAILSLLPRIRRNKSFIFEGLDLGPFYLEDLMCGFMSPIFLDNYLQGRSISKFASLDDRTKLFLGYFEFLCEGRFLTLLLKKSTKPHKIISIQHAQVCNTKLPAVYMPSEISTSNDSIASKVIGPDLFLIHGQQYQDLLAKFFPLERVKILGCLKYAHFPQLLLKFQNQIPKAFVGSNVRVAIFTSTEDYKLLLDLANSLILAGIAVSVKPHPANLLDTDYLQSIKRAGITLSQVDTYDLMWESTHVISGYSSISLEAIYFGKNVCRYFSYFRYPLFAADEGVPVLREPNEVLSWINSAQSSIVDRSVFNRYFSEWDGEQYRRLVSEVKAFMARV